MRDNTWQSRVTAAAVGRRDLSSFSAGDCNAGRAHRAISSNLHLCSDPAFNAVLGYERRNGFLLIFRTEHCPHLPCVGEMMLNADLPLTPLCQALGPALRVISSIDSTLGPVRRACSATSLVYWLAWRLVSDKGLARFLPAPSEAVPDTEIPRVKMTSASLADVTRQGGGKHQLGNPSLLPMPFRGLRGRLFLLPCLVEFRHRSCASVLPISAVSFPTPENCSAIVASRLDSEKKSQSVQDGFKQFPHIAREHRLTCRETCLPIHITSCFIQCNAWAYTEYESTPLLWAQHNRPSVQTSK